jgi:hypothetical protein
MPIAGPTFTIEANFSQDLTGYATIGTMALGTSKLSGGFADAGWVDVSSYVTGFSIRRGRNDELSGVSAGTFTVDIRDDTGRFDPENTGSPYYPNVKLLRRWRITASYNGAVYGLAYGFATDYQSSPAVIESDLSITCTDLFTRMGHVRPRLAYVQERLDQRIHHLLDNMEWPSSQRQIEVSTLTVPAETIGYGPTMLEFVDTALKAERGLFFIAGNGDAVYHARQHRFGAVSRGTFGKGGLPVASVAPAYTENGLFNYVTVTRPSEATQLAYDLPSIALYDARGYDVSGTAAGYLASAGDALSLAQWLLAQRKDPVQRVSSITLDPEGDPDALWPQLLDAEIGDRVTLNHDTPGTAGITALGLFIESIACTWSPLRPFSATWGLSRVPADNDTYMVLGDATSGKIGTGKVAY